MGQSVRVADGSNDRQGMCLEAAITAIIGGLLNFKSNF